MSNFARLDAAGVVIEVCHQEALETHVPALVAQFVACPDYVTAQSQHLPNGTWTVYTAPAPDPVTLPSLNPMDFYLSFTPAERINIKKSSDQEIIEFWATYQLAKDMNYPIDPNLISVREALAYLYSPGGILSSSARVEQIRNGVKQ